MESAVLRLHCPDQKGLVARVSGFVYKHGGNIIAVHQHVEDMRRLGRDVEKQVLARAVNAHIEDKIMFYNNRTIVFDSLY